MDNNERVKEVLMRRIKKTYKEYSNATTLQDKQVKGGKLRGLKEAFNIMFPDDVIKSQLNCLEFIKYKQKIKTDENS